MGNFLLKAAAGSFVFGGVLGGVLVATVPSNEALTTQTRSDITAASNSIVGAAASLTSAAEIRDYVLFKAARVRVFDNYVTYMGVLGRWIRLPN